MVYLRKCCFFVEILLGTIIISFLDTAIDLTAFIIDIIFGNKRDMANYLVIIFFIIHLISCLILFYGTRVRDPIFFLPFLILTIIKVILLFLATMVDIIVRQSLVCIILHSVIIVLNCYFWFVVYSVYVYIGGDLIY